MELCSGKSGSRGFGYQRRIGHIRAKLYSSIEHRSFRLCRGGCPQPQKMTSIMLLRVRTRATTPRQVPSSARETRATTAISGCRGGCLSRKGFKKSSRPARDRPTREANARQGHVPLHSVVRPLRVGTRATTLRCRRVIFGKFFTPPVCRMLSPDSHLR